MSKRQNLHYGNGTIRNVAIISLLFGVGLIAIGVTYFILNVIGNNNFWWLFLVIPSFLVGGALTFYAIEMIVLYCNMHEMRNIKETNDGFNSDHKSLCPGCGYKLLGNENYCPECGLELAKTKICPHCGSRNKEKSKFCFICGEKIK